MALQAGIGISRLVLIIGTGSVGTALYRNGRLADVFGELQKLLSNKEEDDLSEELRRITAEVKRASQSHPVIINGSSSGMDISSMVLPVAAAGAVGYGYMKWKGISFSDLKCVTKRAMAAAVENLNKHLENVTEKIEAAKKHLTQRIENLDGKLDEQVEISKLIRSDVCHARGDLSVIAGGLDELQKMISGFDGRLLSFEEKQELTKMGVMYLCEVVDEKLQVKMPETLTPHLEGVGKSVPTGMILKGLEAIPYL